MGAIGARNAVEGNGFGKLGLDLRIRMVNDASSLGAHRIQVGWSRNELSGLIILVF